MSQCKVSLKDGISCKSCWIGNGSLKMERDPGDANVSEKEENISSLGDSQVSQSAYLAEVWNRM